MFELADVVLLIVVIYELERIRQAVDRTRYLVMKEHFAEPYRGE